MLKNRYYSYIRKKDLYDDLLEESQKVKLEENESKGKKKKNNIEELEVEDDEKERVEEQNDRERKEVIVKQENWGYLEKVNYGKKKR